MNKLARLLLIAFLTLFTFSVVGALQFGIAQTPTPVSGIINSDTTWTQANSPYNLEGGGVLVNNGVTLTIEAGVTVNLEGNALVVNGTLSVRGTNTNPIYLNGGIIGFPNNTIFFTEFSNSWNEQTLSGSIIQKAIVSSATILIAKSSPKIENDTFQGMGIIIDTESQGAPIILNNTFIATNNTNTIANGIGCNGNSTISNNTVFGWPQSGIHIFYGYPIVEGNLIYNNTFGISISSLTNDFSIPSPLIRNNSIVNNQMGVCIIGGPAPKISNNNILYNSNYSIYIFDSLSELFPIQEINATYNWWGTTDTQAINQSIYDFKNAPSLGTISFIPYLNEPNPTTPSIPPDLIIPEFPSLLLPFLLLTAIFCITAACKKTTRN